MKPLNPSRLNLIKACETGNLQALEDFFSTPVARNSDFYAEPLYICAETNFDTGLQYVIDHGAINPTTLSVALHTAIDFEQGACVAILVSTYEKMGLTLPEKAFIMACQKDRPDLVLPLLKTAPPQEFFQIWQTKRPDELQTLLQYMAIAQRTTLKKALDVEPFPAAPVKRL